MLKNMKKACFSYFSWFFLQKLPKNYHYFHFRWSIFSHTPFLSVIYFFTVVDWFIKFEMLNNAEKYEKGLFFLFFLIFCKNCHFFHFRWSIFFHTHHFHLWPTFLQLWTGSSGLKCSIMLKNMKKACFS